MGIKSLLGACLFTVATACTPFHIPTIPDLQYQKKFLDQFPKEYLKLHMDTSASHLNDLYHNYADWVAKEDVRYGEDFKELQKSLVAKLDLQEHVKRTHKFHFIASWQVHDIIDTTQLVLLHKYYDYFSTWNLEDYQKLFPTEYSNEKGGIIVGNDKTIQLIEFANLHATHYGTEDPQGNHSNGLQDDWAQLGKWHTHAQDDPLTMPVYKLGNNLAGPSGRIYGPDESIAPWLQNSAAYRDTGDFASLRARLDWNPKIVDVVVTELERGVVKDSTQTKHYAYNIDVYFDDMKYVDGERAMSLDMITYRAEVKD